MCFYVLRSKSCMRGDNYASTQLVRLLRITKVVGGLAQSSSASPSLNRKFLAMQRGKDDALGPGLLAARTNRIMESFQVFQKLETDTGQTTA